MSNFAQLGQHGLLLEAEVSPRVQAKFEQRYFAATNQVISPGNPVYYQNQPNKFGAELRVYFNDPALAVAIEMLGFPVENSLKAYQGANYRFRVNRKGFWWPLVELHGMRLGHS